MMQTKRAIIINADDIGMHPAVDAAAMRLTEMGIVSSVSLMALAQPDADAINGFYRYGIDVGLHLDFTSEMAVRRYGTSGSIARTIMQTYSGRFSMDKARAVVGEQLQRFCELTGRLPAFIDGHEHVHQLPVVRDALMHAIGTMDSGYRPFIRDTRPRGWHGAKAACIGLLGARALQRQAHAAGCAGNTDFFGVYDLKKDVPLDRLWQAWLQAMPPSGALVMCHPSLSTVSGTDFFRMREYRFLSSALFEEMLYQYNTTVTGWKSALDNIFAHDIARQPMQP
jgi:predicted glycoside hydrolase/deacetylase ChbG (UPF0249 family)